MVTNMNQNYLMINETTNIVENLCVWDGNTQTWTPPAGYLMLVQATTPALIWVQNQDKTDWVLEAIIGAADIGFTWNGTECVTNEPKPQPAQAAENQPTTSGTQDV